MSQRKSDLGIPLPYTWLNPSTRPSRSEDQVSQRLLALFHNAIAPSADELQRARRRREFGDPPGKPENPLGDQVVWEQLLTRCKNSDRNTVWVISADTDYGVVSGTKLILNSFLYRDLEAACRKDLELHCHADLSDGIKEFAKSIGVKENSLPTPQETKQIKEEIDFWNANTSSHTVTKFIHEMPDFDWPSRSRLLGNAIRGHLKPLF